LVGGNPTDIRWHHYALTYDGALATLYVDGVKVGSAGFSGAVMTNSNDILIGGDPLTFTGFDGAIDAVRFYVRALTAAEVEFLYSGTMFGDASSNGTVSAFDASLTAQYGIGLTTLSTKGRSQADVSADGRVTSYDASLIARYSVGLINKFPADAKWE